MNSDVMFSLVIALGLAFALMFGFIFCGFVCLGQKRYYASLVSSSAAIVLCVVIGLVVTGGRVVGFHMHQNSMGVFGLTSIAICLLGLLVSISLFEVNINRPGYNSKALTPLMKDMGDLFAKDSSKNPDADQQLS